jgi:hypothetical protein
LTDHWQDALAIRTVIDRYGTGIDRRHWELVRSCFTLDCTADYGQSGRWTAREPLVAARRVDNFLWRRETTTS